MIVQFWQNIGFSVQFGTTSVIDSSGSLRLYEWTVPDGREGEAQDYIKPLQQTGPIPIPAVVQQIFFTEALWGLFIDANVADADLRVILKMMYRGLNPITIASQNDF